MPRLFRRLSSGPAALLAAAFISQAGAWAAGPREDTPPGGIGAEDCERLRCYARDTWKSLVAMERPGILPADGLRRGKDGAWEATRRASPTDFGAYLWSIIAAERLGLIGADEAGRRIARTLDALGRLERAHGFFYNQYNPRTGERMGTGGGKGSPRPFLSAVDNGWLAAALIMVANARPDLRGPAEELLRPMDFGFFYEPYDPADPDTHPGQFHGGVYTDDHSRAAFYSMLNTEPRIASYVAIVRGQVPPEHYYRLYRTMPRRLGKQYREPEGEYRTYRGVAVFEGHYTFRGMRIVPSWGGSMFEALMVDLFVPEERWAPRAWGVNHPLYVRAQIEQGLEVRRYGAWGFSPACNPEGGYRPYGVDGLGAEPEGYHTHNEEKADKETSADAPGPRPGSARGPRPGRPMLDGIVTPHASFLALPFAPREALDNLKTLAAKYPVYGDLGFLDSVDVRTGAVANCILALDQGMILAAIANALADEAMRHAFCDGAIEATVRPLIAPEEFTAGDGRP